MGQSRQGGLFVPLWGLGVELGSEVGCLERGLQGKGPSMFYWFYVCPNLGLGGVQGGIARGFLSQGGRVWFGRIAAESW